MDNFRTPNTMTALQVNELKNAQFFLSLKTEETKNKFPKKVFSLTYYSVMMKSKSAVIKFLTPIRNHLKSL